MLEFDNFDRVELEKLNGKTIKEIVLDNISFKIIFTDNSNLLLILKDGKGPIIKIVA